MSLIYFPEKDSYLLSKILKKEIKNKDINCLEMGIGSGTQLQTLKEIGIKKKNIFGADINKEAVKYCKKLGFSCVISDLFEKIKEKFDLIIFNPPYLPEDKKEDKESKLATTGGKKGSEIINRFLKQVKSHLTKNGKIFLLTSSLTKDINWNDWKKKKLAEKKLFFEMLYVWELQSDSLNENL